MMDSKTRYKILNSFLHSPKLVELISLSLSPLLSPVVGEGDIAVNINFNILQSLMKSVFLLVLFNFASVFIPIMTPPKLQLPRIMTDPPILIDLPRAGKVEIGIIGSKYKIQTCSS